MNKTTANHAKMKAKKRQQDILSSTDDHYSDQNEGLQKVYLNTLPLNQNRWFTSSRGVLKKFPTGTLFKTTLMENMDRTDQSLQNSKQELTTTIAHLVDTIDEMHTSFAAFMQQTEKRMQQDRMRIDSLNEQAMKMLSAHGSLDEKQQRDKEQIIMLHNDLEGLKDTAKQFATQDQLHNDINELHHEYEQQRKQFSTQYQHHIQGMQDQEREINQLQEDLSKLRNDHTALSEAHEKHKSWWHWFFGQQRVNDPSSQYHLESRYHPED